MSSNSSEASSNRPAGWPPGVRVIGIDRFDSLGVHDATGELYWEGRKVVMQKPITLGGWERFLAALTAMSAVGLLVVEVGRAACWWGG